MPGETFSFNDVVGERTIAAGYKNAAIFVNGQVEDGLAGGICQVSSTLYDAVVGANLQITERHNHSKLTSYLPGGKDATVVWGRYDFQFTNNRQYPIKIEMSVQNGVATAIIYGIKSSEEYEINIESQRVGTAGSYTVYNAYKVYCQNGVASFRCNMRKPKTNCSNPFVVLDGFLCFYDALLENPYSVFFHTSNISCDGLPPTVATHRLRHTP